MDWGKAKNYTIIFLIFLNTVLFFCNICFNKRYVITNEQIDAVKTILNERNIKIDASCEIPVDYSPMLQINFGEYYYDEINIQKIFFPENSEVKRTTDFEKTILSLGDAAIFIKDDIVEFENYGALNKVSIDRESVLKVCEEYASRAEEFFDDLENYGLKEFDDCYIVEYIGRYKNTSVFCNYMRFKISKDGGMRVRLRYFPVKNLYGNEVDICSADEALFIFSEKAGEICGTKDVSVLKIAKGYYFDDFVRGNKIISIPYYRIDVAEKEEPFFVNAYNRTLEE